MRTRSFAGCNLQCLHAVDRKLNVIDYSLQADLDNHSRTSVQKNGFYSYIYNTLNFQLYLLRIETTDWQSGAFMAKTFSKLNSVGINSNTPTLFVFHRELFSIKHLIRVSRKILRYFIIIGKIWAVLTDHKVMIFFSSWTFQLLIHVCRVPEAWNRKCHVSNFANYWTEIFSLEFY